MKQLETDHSYHFRDLWLVSNILTLLRAVFVIPWMAWAIEQHSLAWFIAAGATYWAGDLLDGYVARKLGQCSRLGRDLDSSVDKLTAVVALLAASIEGFFPWRFTFIFLAISVVQIALALAGSRRFPAERRPMTYLPHAAGAALLLSLFPSPLKPYFLILAVLFIANHLWYYALGVFPEIRRLLARIVSLTKGNPLLHQWFRKLTRDVRETSRLFTAANGVTLVRALLIPVTLSVYTHRQWGLLAFLLALFIAGDIADGMIARLNNSATVLGKFLDIAIDKMMLVGFLFLWFQEGRYSPELLIILTVRLTSIALVGGYAYVFGRQLPIAFWSFPANAAFLLLILTRRPTLEMATIALNIQLVFHYMYQLARPRVVYG